MSSTVCTAQSGVCDSDYCATYGCIEEKEFMISKKYAEAFRRSPPATSSASPIHLPADAKARKALPIVTGAVDYFPDALVEVAMLSKVGNDQHNPGQPLHWSKHKSTDHADCIGRHLIDRGTRDTDGVRHSTKVAWRALALLQIELEADRAGLSVEGYLAKLKADAEAKQQPEGWRPWEGGASLAADLGPADLGPDTLVEVQFREGSTGKDRAGVWYWKHNGDGSDIVAYRVISP